MIFIPSSDYSSKASEATAITSLDFVSIQIGEFATRSIRIGNPSSDPVTVILSSPDAAVTFDPGASFTLEPDQISRTITIIVSPPVDEPDTMSHDLDVLATVAGGEIYRLRVSWTAIGVNEPRHVQYPDRATDFTDNVSDVVIRGAAPIRLYRYDPIPFVAPEPNRVKFKNGRIYVPNSQTRLDPLDGFYGYARSNQTVLGGFQSESENIPVTFEQSNAGITYSATATLYLDSSFEPYLQPVWALFAPATEIDPEQYKRTVFLFLRQGDIWVLHQVRFKERGNEMGFIRCDIVQLNRPNRLATAYYNPFSWTYRKNSDKPYAVFPYDPGDLFPSLDDNSSNSSWSS
jgi:hypothetical protein